MHYASLTLLILLSLSFGSDMVRAEQIWNRWMPKNGVAVRQGNAVEWNHASAVRQEGELAGEIAYVWEDTRDGCRGIAIQVIDRNGDPKFDENGIKLFKCDFTQMEPQVTSTPDGGWIIAWQDFRNPIPDVHYTKITEEGDVLWGAENYGLAVNAEFAYFDVKAVEDGEGGCYITWGTAVEGRGSDIFATHVLANGELDARWREGGINITDPELPDNYYSIITDGEGGFIVAWLQAHNRAVDLFAQRVAVDGSLLWNDGDRLEICANTAVREIPQVAPDGNGGAFICWADFRDLNQNAEDIYVQRVDADGNNYWDNGGVLLASGELQTLKPTIIPTEPGYAVVSWESCDVNEFTTDIYAMMISGEEELQRNWSPDSGVPIVTAENDQRQVSMTLAGDRGILFTWGDGRDGRWPSEFDIWAQLVDFDGERVWNEDGVPVCRMEEHQSEPTVSMLGNGDCFVAWHPTSYFSSAGVQGQIFDPDNGDNIGDENGFDIATGMYGDARSSNLIRLRDEEFAVVWSDSRSAYTEGWIPMIQYYRNNGDEVEALFDGNGIRVTDNPDQSISSHVVAVKDGDGGVIVLWEVNRLFDRYVVYGQKFNAAGEKMWSDEGLIVGESDMDLRNTLAISDGIGGVYLAFRTMSKPDYYSQVIVQHIDDDGEQYWDHGTVKFTSEAEDCILDQLVLDADGSLALLWQTNLIGGRHDLWLSYISEDGEQIWDNEPQIVDDQRVLDAQLLLHPDGFAVTWKERQDDDARGDRLKTQFVTYDGNTLWNQYGTTVCGTDGYKSDIKMIVDNSELIWMAWSDLISTDQGQFFQIFVQKLEVNEGEEAPSYLFENNGKQVAETTAHQGETRILHDGNNGIWVAWSSAAIREDKGVFATHLNPDGEMYEHWSTAGNLISDVPHDQRLQNAELLQESGDGGIVLVWDDERSSDVEEHNNVRVSCDEGTVINNLYMQRVTDFIPASVDAKISTNIPGEFEIKSTFPNPFNSRIQIIYTLATNQDVSFQIFDISGRSMFNSAAQPMKIGDHSVTVDATNWATGIYLAQLTVGEVSKTVKLTCIK